MDSVKKKKKRTDFNDQHVNYLLRIFENEENRLNKLENKITQIIAQSGLIISIITFIIPLFYETLKCICKLPIKPNCLKVEK
jgi:hypothetical protein